MDNMIYLEMVVLCAFIACSVGIIYYVRKLSLFLNRISYMVEDYQAHLVTTNNRLYNIETDTYYMVQKSLKNGTEEPAPPEQSSK